MSVSTVITLGYGSFGSPSFVTRLGFGSGADVLERDYTVDPWTVFHAQNRMDRLSMDRDDRFHAERWDSFTGDRGDA